MSPDSVMGVDVSGKSLDVHILPQGRSGRFPNDLVGIGELIDLAKDLDVGVIVMEATGGLETALTVECGLRGMLAVVMNPRQIRDFAPLRRQTCQDRLPGRPDHSPLRRCREA